MPRVGKVPSARRPRDAYYTPDEVAWACVNWLPWNIRGRTVLEPHVGGGAFARALTRRGATVLGNDIYGASTGFEDCKRHTVGDFLEYETKEPVFAVVGNPPYRVAEAHVRRALSLTSRVAFLLRMAFLESSGRKAFWQAHPCSEVHVLSERPSFTDDGATDHAAYAWFVWGRPTDEAPNLFVRSVKDVVPPPPPPPPLSPPFAF